MRSYTHGSWAQLQRVSTPFWPGKTLTILFCAPDELCVFGSRVWCSTNWAIRKMMIVGDGVAQLVERRIRYPKIQKIGGSKPACVRSTRNICESCSESKTLFYLTYPGNVSNTCRLLKGHSSLSLFKTSNRHSICGVWQFWWEKSAFLFLVIPSTALTQKCTHNGDTVLEFFIVRRKSEDF